MYNYYSNELKSNCVNSYTDGNAVRDICVTNNVPRSTLYYWLNQNKVIIKTYNQSITYNDYSVLKLDLKQTKIENAILKELDCTYNSPQSVKFKTIDKLSVKYPVRAICRVLNVNHSNYYHDKNKKPAKTYYELMDELHKPIVKIIFDRAKGRLGARKIKALLELEKIFTSEERVSRIMKELYLVCVANKKGKRYNQSPKQKFNKNIVDRDFNIDKPNKVWVSDITTIYVNYQPYYLCVVLDLAARKVVGYSIGNHQETSLIELAFEKALKSRKPDKGLVFHSDQGLQFTSYKFKTLLRNKGVVQSLSNAGCSYDNAVAESFFRHLKSEQVYHTYYPNYNAFKESIDEYVDFFNNYRPHHYLKMKIPAHYEKESFGI